ncbi:secreted signal peptide protein [Xanthomonas tesorieronis]|uniref:secreted signal peptide protein n=1 Tax=Xanthomonas tesorieronis TaxID=3160839 RepID=UPI0035192771
MTPRSLSLFALLAFGMAIAQVHAADSDAAACTRALQQAFAASANATALPAACTRIGPVALGMRKQQVLAALGQPDVTRADAAHPQALSVVYLYPRELNAQLARQPRAAGTLAHSQLAVRFRDDRVTNLIAFADPNAPLPFDLLGQPVGTHIDRLLQAIGGQPQWNASRDYVQFAAMPLGVDVDPDTSAIVGLNIAASKADLDSFDLPGLQLRKDANSGLVNGIR